MNRLGPLFLLPQLGLLLAAFLFLSTSEFARYDFPLDDAWTHRVYSRAVAKGEGFQYNDQSFETGATSPLWVIASAPLHLIPYSDERHIAFAVKILGLILTSLILYTLQTVLLEIYADKRFAALATLLVCLDPRWMMSALSGMANPLLLLLLLITIRCLLKNNMVSAAFCYGLATVTRPEALALLPLFWGWSLWQRQNQKQENEKEKKNKHLYPTLFISLTPFALWASFCKMATGSFLPLTYHTKMESTPLDLADLKLLIDFIPNFGPWHMLLCATGLLTWAAIVFHAHKGKEKERQLFLMLTGAGGVLLLVVLASRQMYLKGYYWTRWADPGVLLLGIAIAIGITHLLLANQAIGKLNHHTIRMLGVVALLSSLPQSTKSWQNRRFHLSSDASNIHDINVKTGQWLKENTPKTAIIGANDAGGIRYFSDRYIIDLIGLNHSGITLRGIKNEMYLDAVDWLAVYPIWFKDLEQSQFRTHLTTEIAAKDYSVCPCPSQRKIVVMERLD